MTFKIDMDEKRQIGFKNAEFQIVLLNIQVKQTINNRIYLIFKIEFF